MSNNTNNSVIEDVKQVERSTIQRYLQDPLSSGLSKLATLFHPTLYFSLPHLIENDRFEQCQLYPSEQYLYSHFTDRVDPSLYYTIFFPFQHY